MKRNIIVLVAIYFICVVASLGLAQSSNSSEPLPLKHGTYVGKHGGNADTFYYNGEGISSPRVTCKITKITRNGNIYNITQECVGEDGKDIEESTLTIKSKTSVITNGETYDFRGANKY